MRIEQVALPVLRWVNSKPRLQPVLDVAFKPFNPFSPALNVDPYPAYERLRAKGPVVYATGLNAWMVSSYELCEEVLRSPVSVDRGDLFDTVAPWSRLSTRTRETFTRSLLLVDPPDHTRLRKLVSRAFTPRTVERIAPRVQEIAAELVAEAAAQPRVDLFKSVFAPLPIYVIGELLGIPERDWPRLKAWSDEIAKAIDPIHAFAVADMERAVAELTEALDGWVAERTASPGDDLLSQLIVAADPEDGRLSGEELRSMVTLLMVAGHETTSGLLGNAVVALERRPTLRARMADDPAVVPNAVEELLRYDSPVQNTDRIIVEPVELGGHTIKAGAMVTLLIGAANRDPDRFEQPHSIDFDRTDVRPLSFGHGIHHCLGAALARLEARTVLPLVFGELPDHRIDRSGLRWKSSLTLRGPIELPVALPGA